MKIKALKELSKEALEKKEEEAKMELLKLNSQKSSGANPKNPGQIKQLRKTIARIKTLQNQK